jgi:hypothetical protein
MHISRASFGFSLLLPLLVHCSSDPVASTSADTGAAGANSNPGGSGAAGTTGGLAGSGGSGAGGEAGNGGQSGSPGCSSHADCLGETPFCDPESTQCAAAPEGGAIGWGDGSPDSVTLTPVYEPTFKREATDLAFHPTRAGELWVLHREFPKDAPCTASVETGCAALEGSISILSGVGTPEQKATVRKDPNGWHFLRRPPALAFGANETFATCGEFRTANLTDDLADYMGPTLWSSEPAQFGKQPPGKNGSHLDMIHTSPFGVGIAHEKENVYWVFNGKMGSLDRVDFKEDHGPGNEDHSDGEVLRYGQGAFKRAPETPGHLVFDTATATVLIADTGNQRVARLDPSTATVGTSIPAYEPLAVRKKMNGATITDVVPPGTLEAPSGLELAGNVLYVSDAMTSRIHAFKSDGTPLRSLDTGLPAGSLAGLALSPEGTLFFVEKPTAKVFRIDPKK